MQRRWTDSHRRRKRR